MTYKKFPPRQAAILATIVGLILATFVTVFTWAGTGVLMGIQGIQGIEPFGSWVGSLAAIFILMFLASFAFCYAIMKEPRVKTMKEDIIAYAKPSSGLRGSFPLNEETINEEVGYGSAVCMLWDTREGVLSSSSISVGLIRMSILG